MDRNRWAAVIGAVIVAFGGGFLMAKGVDGTLFHPGEKGASIWSMFGHPRDANAPRAGEQKPDGFAIWKTRLDTSSPNPLACIKMTRELDPSKSYGDFVLVSPDLGHAPAVTAKGDELCIGGVGFTDRHVTLLKGLPAKTGETLDANADTDFTNGDKPPYVGFAGSGVILPREDSDGVGIETVNVTKLRIEVWRVVDRNLVRKSISAPDPTGEGSYADDYGDDSPDDEGSVVWKGYIDVKGDPGQHTTTVFPLGAVLKEMKPGGYVIKARDASGGRDLTDKADEGTPPAQARRWVIFTDMALTAYTGSDALDVVVRSLKSAKTLAGVPVTLMAKDGETLATAKSDAMGRVTFAHSLLDGEGSQTAKMVMAYGDQGDLAVLDLERSPTDLSKQGAGGTPGAPPADLLEGRSINGGVDGYLYADRGIYRPGETVHLVSLVRDREARAVADRKGQIVVKRPSGLEFKRFPFTASPGGAIETTIALPNTAPRGHWTAELQIDGFKAAAGDLGFQVEDFVPQRLAVTTEGQAQVPVGAADTRAINVTARFLYGAIGAGLQTQGEARLRPDPNPFPAFADYRWGDETAAFDEKEVDLGTTVTDGAGHAALSLAGSAGRRHGQSGAGAGHRLGVRAGRPARARERQPEAAAEAALPRGQGRPGRRGGRRAAAGQPRRDRGERGRRPDRRARRQLQPDQRELELRLVPAGRQMAVAAHQPRHRGEPGLARRRRGRAGAHPAPQAGLGRLPAGAERAGRRQDHHPLHRRLGRAGRRHRGAGPGPSRAGQQELQPGRYGRNRGQGAVRRRGAGGRRHRPADRLQDLHGRQGRRHGAAENLGRLGRRRLCAGERDPAARPGHRADAEAGARPGLRPARPERSQADRRHIDPGQDRLQGRGRCAAAG